MIFKETSLLGHVGISNKFDYRLSATIIKAIGVLFLLFINNRINVNLVGLLLS